MGVIAAVEYFHGGNGAAVGAAYHTGLIADVIRRRHGQVRSVGDKIRGLGEKGQARTTAVLRSAISLPASQCR